MYVFLGLSLELKPRRPLTSLPLNDVEAIGTLMFGFLPLYPPSPCFNVPNHTDQLKAQEAGPPLKPFLRRSYAFR